jgi:agmatinase
MSPPTYAIPPTFLGVERAAEGARFVVAGVPTDLAVSNRAGTRDGPHAIRRASRMLVDGAHPVAWVEPAAMSLADIGNFALPLGDIPGTLAAIEAQAAACAHLIALGGDHGITLPLLRALRKRLGAPLGLLHFDAHCDTWPGGFGQDYGHGNPFFHAINEGLVDPRRMVSVGLRSPVQREVHDWTVGQGVAWLDAQSAIEDGPRATAERVRAVLGAGPCYLSFDVDACDPAHCPGTGTPEPGGLTTAFCQGVLRRLGGLSFVGMDVVEVSPAFDVSEITALWAATVAWEYLAVLAPRD